MKFLENAKTKLVAVSGRAGLKIQKYSPEILLGVGIVSFAGTVVMACRATLKAQEVLEEHNDAMDMIEEAIEVAADPEEYSEEDVKKDKMTTYCKTAVKLAKLYAPAVALGALSLTSILASRNILNKRYLAVTAAYNGLSEVFNTYRKRVRDELGDQMDRHFRYGSEIQKVDTEYTDENGKTKKKKEEVENVDPEKRCPDDTSVFFDEGNPNWDRNPEFCRAFLNAQCSIANNILQARGHIFLNEVYDMLGFPHTQIGSVIGWVKGLGDDYIDFGLYNPENEEARRFVNGKSNAILLQFNHDGVIWNKI